MKASLIQTQNLKGSVMLGSGGTKYYSDLLNKPSINGVELENDKTSEELGLMKYYDLATKEDIELLFKREE